MIKSIWRLLLIALFLGTTLLLVTNKDKILPARDRVVTMLEDLVGSARNGGSDREEIVYYIQELAGGGYEYYDLDCSRSDWPTMCQMGEVKGRKVRRTGRDTYRASFDGDQLTVLTWGSGELVFDIGSLESIVVSSGQHVGNSRHVEKGSRFRAVRICCGARPGENSATQPRVIRFYSNMEYADTLAEALYELSKARGSEVTLERRR